MIKSLSPIIAVLPFAGLIPPDVYFENETLNKILLLGGLSNVVLGHYLINIFFIRDKNSDNRLDLSKKLTQYLGIFTA